MRDLFYCLKKGGTMAIMGTILLVIGIMYVIYGFFYVSTNGLQWCRDQCSHFIYEILWPKYKELRENYK